VYLDRLAAVEVRAHQYAERIDLVLHEAPEGADEVPTAPALCGSPDDEGK
jgi:hypothetical protein